MKKKVIGVLICTLLITLVLPVTGTVDIGQKNSVVKISTTSMNDIDWWPMYHHDLQLTGYTTSIAPNTNKVLWTAGTFDYFWYNPQRSSPAIVDDTIYLGVVNPSYTLLIQSNSEKRSENYDRLIRNILTNGSEAIEASSQKRWYEAYLFSMNATTGVENWKTRLPDEFYVMGSAAVAEEKVYITATEDISSPFGHLYCLDASNGAILWSFPLNEYWFVSPVVNNGKVYASGWILGENYTRMCRLYCLNAETGVEIFNSSLGFGEPIDAAAIYNNLVYVFVWDEDAGETYLYCIDALNGTYYWSKNLLGNYLGSSPVIYNDKVYVTSNFYDGNKTLACYIWCLNALTGSVIWDQYIEGGTNTWSVPAVAYDRLFITISNELDDTGWLYCLDASTSDIFWSKFISSEGVLYSSPAVADGKIYISSLSYFTFRGNLYCLDAMSGDSIWQYWLIYGTYSSPAIADGRLYIAIGGQFFAFDDTAPANDPPTVTISGPKWGLPGNEYNFTIVAEDPEGPDLFVVFQWSLEYPSIQAGVMPSGLPYVIGIPFDDEGEYWIRVRAQDEEHAWSDWEQIIIKIGKIEVQSISLLGSIKNVEQYEDYTYITVNKVLSFRILPPKFRLLSSGEEIAISNKYFGFIGKHFIIGRFKADLN